MQVVLSEPFRVAEDCALFEFALPRSRTQLPRDPTCSWHSREGQTKHRSTFFFSLPGATIWSMISKLSLPPSPTPACESASALRRAHRLLAIVIVIAAGGGSGLLDLACTDSRAQAK